jgi:hypothetical protein
VVLLTVVSWLANGPTSPLATGYLLLTGAAALRFRAALVWYVNGLAIAGYLALEIDALRHHPELAAPPHHAFIFLVMLGLIALIFHLLLRRVRGPAAVGGPDAGQTALHRPS